MTTRAVHLEMGHDLSSDTSLTTLGPFFARKGTHSEISSENSTNFTAAEKELMTTFDGTSMNQFFGYHQISWKFKPVYAQHFGGVWAQLIRSVKNSLYVIIGSEALTDDTFNTLLCEIEQYMNDRPITIVSSSPCDIEALTVNHLFLETMLASMPPRIISQASTLMKQWKFEQQLSNYIWKCLIKEFIQLCFSDRNGPPKLLFQLDNPFAF